MANTLRFKRGLVSGIPTAALGEPLFTTDTFDLYIGNGTGNTRFQKYIASGTTSQLLRGDGSLLTMPIVLTSPSNGQVLKYDGTNWVNSADAGVTGSGANGRVAYWDSASTINGTVNFFWDNSTNRLGINTSSPAQPLHVISGGLTTANFAHTGLNGGIDVRNTATLAVNRDAQIRLVNGTTYFGANDRSYQLVNVGRSGTAADYYIQYWDGTNYLDRFRIFSTGNVGINTGTTDNGLRFQVTGDGYFSGSVGIGTSTLTGRSLSISKTITGATSSYGILNDGVIQPDVTSIAGYNRVVMSKAAGAATSIVVGYWAVQGAYSGTVDTQYGFLVDSTVNGATNNYAFFSNIASGTGRWNLYMNGTAANYVNGELLVGSTASTGQKFQVTGNAKITDTLSLKNGTSASLALNFTLATTTGIYNFDDGVGANMILQANGVNNQLVVHRSGNIGVGLQPILTSGGYRNIQNGNAIMMGSTSDAAAYWSANATFNSGWKYIINGFSSRYEQALGSHYWFNAQSGTAGNAVTFTQAMTLFATGNLAVGTTSDAGFRLDVNGTMRVSGASTFLSSVTAASFIPTSSTIPTNGMYLPAANTVGFSTNSTEDMRLTSGGNLLINTTTDSGERLQVNGTAKIGTHSTTGFSLVVQNNGANDTSGIRISTGATVDGYISMAYDATNTYGSIQAGDNNVFRNIVINRQGGSVGIGANPNNSAVLQADSTTRGFLPPRMTTTQRNAIPTPAAGLIVYDTTDNKHYGYNGTTWNAFY